MKSDDISALVERLRAAARRLTIDIADAEKAADALEALQAEIDKFVVYTDAQTGRLARADMQLAEAKRRAFADGRRAALEEAANLVQRSGQSDELIRIATAIRVLRD